MIKIKLNKNDVAEITGVDDLFISVFPSRNSANVEIKRESFIIKADIKTVLDIPSWNLNIRWINSQIHFTTHEISFQLKHDCAYIDMGIEECSWWTVNHNGVRRLIENEIEIY